MRKRCPIGSSLTFAFSTETLEASQSTGLLIRSKQRREHTGTVVMKNTWCAHSCMTYAIRWLPSITPTSGPLSLSLLSPRLIIGWSNIMEYFRATTSFTTLEWTAICARLFAITHVLHRPRSSVRSMTVQPLMQRLKHSHSTTLNQWSVLYLLNPKPVFTKLPWKGLRDGFE